jgi:tRNA (guanine-N(7)-)-methyltransferase
MKMAAVTLYNSAGSTCSQRVRFVLAAKGIEFEKHDLNLLAGDQLKPEYLKINPNGVVPTLVHNGTVVTDSSVIIEYLDEVFPQPERFVPADAGRRAAMRSLMRFIDEVPTPAVRVPSFNLAFISAFRGMDEQEFVAVANAKPLRKEFMLAMGRTGFSDADMAQALDRLGRSMRRMNEEITNLHDPGAGHCLLQASQHQVENLRIVIYDALDVLQQQVPDESLNRINLYFPDPWPKKRHHKRRIVQRDFLRLVAKKLITRGSLHIATDWENYAQHIDEILASETPFRIAERREHGGENALDRPMTKFERRGLGKGHRIWDWRLVKISF